LPATPAARTEDGLVIYHFSADLYYANSNYLLEEAVAILATEPPVRWFCLDAVSMTDVDYTGGQVLAQLHGSCTEKGARLVLAQVQPDVLDQLRRYGTIDALGADAVYEMLPDVVAAFEQAAPGA
jgi:MFS superfamily sulfate permease-like transporter